MADQPFLLAVTRAKLVALPFVLVPAARPSVRALVRGSPMRTATLTTPTLTITTPSLGHRTTPFRPLAERLGKGRAPVLCALRYKERRGAVSATLPSYWLSAAGWPRVHIGQGRQQSSYTSRPVSRSERRRMA